jgi:hypothetical protein
MNQRLMLTLAVLAGFAGGVLSQYVSPMLVQAQSSPIRVNAQSFNLVDKTGAYIGGIAVDGGGKITVTMRDTESDKSFYIVDPVGGLKNQMDALKNQLLVP